MKKQKSKLIDWHDYKRRNDKVLIVGLSYNVLNAPVHDYSFDRWTLNGGWSLFNDKLDLCFDMHDWQSSEYTVPYYSGLKETDIGCPLVVPVYNSYIVSQQIEYPIEEIRKVAGTNLRNSIPEMIMFSWLVGYKDIYIVGIDSNEFDKYPDMGHSLYYAIGFVRAMGVKVFFMNDYKMDDQYFYGYQIMKIKDARG